MSHLEGKVVVVTGAASGFGRLISRGVVARGAVAVGLDVDAAGLDETFADDAAGSNARSHGVVVDVRDRTAVAAAVDAVLAEHGSVDVLVNNAGVMPLAFLADHDRAADAWDRCIDINLKGVLHGIYAVYDHMVRQGSGHIVNIASIYGNAGVAGAAVYSATKAAVIALSDALRVEAQGRIKVTVVRPTGVPGTNLGSGVLDGAAILPMAGHQAPALLENLTALFGGTMPAEQLDPDDVRYWTISPEELAEQVVWAIDQPAGVAIADLTVRATGENYVY